VVLVVWILGVWQRAGKSVKLFRLVKKVLSGFEPASSRAPPGSEHA